MKSFTMLEINIKISGHDADELKEELKSLLKPVLQETLKEIQQEEETANEDP